MPLHKALERGRIEARSARLRAERRRLELLSLRSGLVAAQTQLALIKLQRALYGKYRPDQPRVPAGNPEGGQWTSEGGWVSSHTRHSAQARAVVAGGFTREQLNLTVGDFASQNCIGAVRREIPGQFLGSTIADVMTAARSGDAAARKCLKILREDRFRK